MSFSRSLPLIALSTVLFLSACGNSVDTSADTKVSDEGGTMKMSMKDLAKLGKNYTCTFSDIDQDGNHTEGTVYVQGDQNFRGEFAMTDKKGKKSDSHMITADKVSYMWSSDEKQGIMIKQPEGEDSSAGGSADVQEKNEMGVNEDQPMDMNCKKWSPDGSKFTPPKDRTFIDFQAQMDASMKKQAGGSQCGVCDQIPDADGKAECRKAMKC